LGGQEQRQGDAGSRQGPEKEPQVIGELDVGEGTPGKIRRPRGTRLCSKNRAPSTGAVPLSLIGDDPEQRPEGRQGGAGRGEDGDLGLVVGPRLWSCHIQLLSFVEASPTDRAWPQTTNLCFWVARGLPMWPRPCREEPRGSPRLHATAVPRTPPPPQAFWKHPPRPRPT